MSVFLEWIIIGSDRRPETKQGIEGKIDRFRSGALGLGMGIGLGSDRRVTRAIAPTKILIVVYGDSIV